MIVMIDIPKSLYTSLKERPATHAENLALYEYITNGIPLPKGHGDIIDRNKIEYMRAIHDLKWGKITASECATKIRYSAPTIIEAEKEKEDEYDD